ncbi:alpha/beta fold hydrolase [Roseomonas xinghualingensis]|uniref:alpha/beta fold hydrolase n=1 Tax=Roseomonas xinghualingensis TaxID=2986475 RepID=UPI0021F17C10|nr:alpha/beta hydrolase [Roseomonas sp. SXEYE001]MCV4209957.1 alpha/beta hydrolase [Roseomonas sp. SXEYE001]
MNFSLPSRQRGTVVRADCEIAYEIAGQGPPLVFAHGLGGCLLSWFQQVAYFAPRFTCVTFSHRGFYPSTAPANGPDPQAYADDLASLVDELGLGPIHLVCQSMGGWTGVEYALMRPTGVRALVLAATTGSINPRLMREPERTRYESWLAEALVARDDLHARNIHPAAGGTMAREQPVMHLLYRQLDALSGSLDKEGLRERMGKMRRRAPEELATARCPVLFLAGSEDVVMPPFSAAALASAVPSSRAAVIHGAGHSAYFERPDMFNALVDAFLAELA